MSGLLVASGARAEAAAARFGPEPPVEVCEALPWDVAVEQAAATDAGGHWRHGVQDAPQSDRPRPQGQSAWRLR